MATTVFDEHGNLTDAGKAVIDNAAYKAANIVAEKTVMAINEKFANWKCGAHDQTCGAIVSLDTRVTKIEEREEISKDSTARWIGVAGCLAALAEAAYMLLKGK